MIRLWLTNRVRGNRSSIPAGHELPFSLSVVLITTVAVGAIHFGIFVVSGFLATGSHTSLPRHGVAEIIWQITRFPATPLRRFLYSNFALQNNLGIGLFIFNSLAWGLAVGMIVSWLTRSMRLPRGQIERAP